MKVKMTVRKRTKIDGLSGISTTVKLLVDMQVGRTGVQTEIEVPEEEYDTFKPGTMWETELTQVDA